MKDNYADIDIEEIKDRFGFSVKLHRIGELDLKVAEIDRVDRMVSEIYPEAVIEHGDAPVWMITWPAAYGLAEYLLHNLNIKGKRVLELGCGTAAPGIALSMAGADVVSTDYDYNTLAMARYNGKLNNSSSFKTHFLDWYKPDLKGYFDLIVGSDIVYFEKSFGPLLSVLKKYISPTGQIILSDQGRPQMKDFLELCAGDGFSYTDNYQMVYLPDLTKKIRIIILTL